MANNDDAHISAKCIIRGIEDAMRPLGSLDFGGDGASLYKQIDAAKSVAIGVAIEAANDVANRYKALARGESIEPSIEPGEAETPEPTASGTDRDIGAALIEAARLLKQAGCQLRQMELCERVGCSKAKKMRGGNRDAMGT